MISEKEEKLNLRQKNPTSPLLTINTKNDESCLYYIKNYSHIQNAGL